MRRGNFGQLWIDEALPASIRGKKRILDSKGLSELMAELHAAAPEQYAESLKNLSDIGRRVSTESGGFSFGPEDLIESDATRTAKERLAMKLNALIESGREKEVIKELMAVSSDIPKKVYEEQLWLGNPMAKQIASGSRGNPAAMARLTTGDMLYVDHKDRPVPYPILHGFAEGLDPAEYFAASFGGRKGVVDAKLSVQNSGALAKLLKQSVHRLVVSKQRDDIEEDPESPIGLPVATDDKDSIGSLLARDVGGYKRNTIITSRILDELKSKGIDDILVRSPISGRNAPGGGLYAGDVGIRESGRMADIGEIPGINASDTLSEQIGQSTLSSKHSGGAAGSSRSVGGFKALQQMINVPKTFPGGAAHADTDGTIESIRPHEDGGTVVTIGGKEHYVSPGFNVTRKIGEVVEAGDAISEGLSNPLKVAEHKGHGEARRQFLMSVKPILDELKVKTSRRNLEMVARGLIQHVRIEDEVGPYFPGDIVPFTEIEKYWEPREDSEEVGIGGSSGKYLEKPVLHYTVGTKIRPSVTSELKKFGIKKVTVNRNPPPFRSTMVRAQDALRHDPDWMTRFLGSNLQDSLLDSVHTGASSDLHSTSFVPSVAAGKVNEFGPIHGLKKADALSGPTPNQPMIGTAPSVGCKLPDPPKPTAAAKPALPKMPSSRASVLAGLKTAAPVGATVAAGTGAPPMADPAKRILPNVPKPAPAPKPNSVLPTTQPKAVTGITEGSHEIMPGVKSNPLIKEEPEPAPKVSPMTQAAIGALGVPVSQAAGLPGLAAMTDLAERGGSSLQRLFGDNPNPDEILYTDYSGSPDIQPRGPIANLPQLPPPQPIQNVPPPQPVQNNPSADPQQEPPAVPPQAGVGGLIAGGVGGALASGPAGRAAGNIAARIPVRGAGLAGRIAGGGAVAAGIPLAADTIQQLVETGKIDPNRVKTVIKETAPGAAIFTAAQAALKGRGMGPLSMISSLGEDLYSKFTKGDQASVDEAGEGMDDSFETGFGKVMRGEKVGPWDAVKSVGSTIGSLFTPSFSKAQAARQSMIRAEEAKNKMLGSASRIPGDNAEREQLTNTMIQNGDMAGAMKTRMQSASSDAAASFAQLTAGAPSWSLAGPKKELWNQLLPQMQDLARARVQLDYGMKEDGTAMSVTERARLAEAVKQRAQMIERNKKLMSQGFLGDLFS